MALHGMAHSFTELCKPLRHDKAVIHEGVTEAEEIKKREQEYTEQLNKKDLNNPDNHEAIWDRHYLIQRQTFWSVKSSEPQEALLTIKLVEVMKVQQGYLKF